MTIKILRLRIGRELLEKIGLTGGLEDLVSVEIRDAYQYDQKNFFSLQRIRFKPGRIASMDTILREKMEAEYYEVLHKQGDELFCIIKQSREKGFFPKFALGPWAILSPFTVDENNLHLNVPAETEFLQRLIDALEKITQDYQIISKNVNLKELEEIGQFRMPSPNFTPKQSEIATYAGKHGYFESPKKITAKAIAEHFGITESAVNMHLKNAENLAMKLFFGGA